VTPSSSSEPDAVPTGAIRSRDERAFIRPATLLRAPIPPWLLAVGSLLGYGTVRLLAGVHDPFGIGLAAVPLFVAAIFLGRRAAILVGLAIGVLTIGPIALTARWTVLDWSTLAELTVLAVSAIFLRLAFGRIAARDASRAAREASLNDRIESVLGIAQRLTTSLDRNEVFGLIVSEMNRAAATDATTIRIRQGDTLELVAWAGLTDAIAGQLPVLATGEDWFQEIEQTRRPWYRDDVPADRETESGRLRYERYDKVARIAAELVVPLLQDDRVIGVMSAVSFEPRSWTAGDIEFAEAVATHASIAIHNADLFGEAQVRAGQLAVLQAASARMSRQNTIESVGRAIVEEIRQIIDYHNCRVYMLEETAELIPIAFEGIVGAYEQVDFELLRTKLGEGFTGWVGQHGLPLLINDANADPRGATIPGTDEVDESMLVVPMRYDERVIGVITLSKLGLRQFDEDNLRLLSILADQAATAVESARLLTRSERLALELGGLLDMSSALSESLDPRQVADLIARHLATAMDVERCAISYWERTTERLLTWGYWPAGELEGIEPYFDLSDYPETRRVLERQVTSVTDTHDPQADRAEVALLVQSSDRMLAMLPLVAKGTSIGLVELISRSPKTFDATRLELARTMANEAAMALENARLYEDARKLADRDQLTGFFNHRYLHERLGEEVVRSQRSKTPLAVMMIDLDGFKLVNDTFGHLFGDRVLAWVAEELRATLRASDIPARYGGDEFAIILPDTDREAAWQAAQRILSALTERAYQSPDRSPVSIGCSIGVAAYPVDGRTAQDLIARADAAMYRVKGAGGAAAELAVLRGGQRRSRAGRSTRSTSHELVAIRGSAPADSIS
jgi:diguanylate cyclase (GGDEF)-like protein